MEIITTRYTTLATDTTTHTLNDLTRLTTATFLITDFSL
jgi:hypothetical protein